QRRGRQRRIGGPFHRAVCERADARFWSAGRAGDRTPAAKWGEAWTCASAGPRSGVGGSRPGVPISGGTGCGPARSGGNIRRFGRLFWVSRSGNGNLGEGRWGSRSG